MAIHYIGHSNCADNEAYGHDPATPYKTIQYALDNTVAGDIIYIKADADYLMNSTDQPIAAIDVDTGGGNKSNNTWKIIEGYTATPGDGGIVTVNANSNYLTIFNIADIENIVLRNIHATNNLLGYHGFLLRGDTFGVIFENCAASYCSYGFTDAGDSATFASNTLFKNCTAHHCRASGFAFWSIHTIALDFINCIAHDNAVIGFIAIQSVLFFCHSYENPVTGFSLYSPSALVNCTSYHASMYDGIDLIDSPWGGYHILYNNVSWGNEEYDINLNSGSVYGDYNCYGAGKIFNYTAGPHDITSDPLFMDAANGNFRARNPAVLRGGLPDIAGNPTQIGAILQKYQFTKRARTANLGRVSIFR